MEGTSMYWPALYIDVNGRRVVNEDYLYSGEQYNWNWTSRWRFEAFSPRAMRGGTHKGGVMPITLWKYREAMPAKLANHGHVYLTRLRKLWTWYWRRLCEVRLQVSDRIWRGKQVFYDADCSYHYQHYWSTSNKPQVLITQDSFFGNNETLCA